MKKLPVKTILFCTLLLITAIGGIVIMAAGLANHSTFYMRIAIVCFAIHFASVGVYDRLHKNKAPILFFVLALMLLFTLFFL